MLMSPPNQKDRFQDIPNPSSSHVARRQNPIPKNYSTSNLLSVVNPPKLSLSTPRNRYSLDVESVLRAGEDADKLSQSPMIPEHAGEHGLGLSGLRRIRQEPSAFRDNGSATAPQSRSASLSLSPNVSRSPNPSRSPSSSLAMPPVIKSIEDLSRFPSESLHSFSFAHQSEESIHNRQNVLKRSMDFMRDKLGWAASNPGLAAAQARLSGDHEVQSMMELLSRANLIGDDAHHAHGLGIAAPITGPADISGNPFDDSFSLPRSESPDHLAESIASVTSFKSPDLALDSLSQLTEKSTEIRGETTLDTLSKAVADDPSHRETAPRQPRSFLKRTLTNTDDLSLQSKLNETLAQPYTVNEGRSIDPSPSRYPGLPPLKLATSMTAPPNHMTPVTAAPHGHGNRWAPVSQAIFTTEANAPWTITAANDLACLVFGVTNAEVRKLGILEVVKEERRKWLEDKLRDPEGGSSRKAPLSQSQRSSPSATTHMKVGSGITAKLLSKPSSRVTGVGSKRRAQTDDGVGSSFTSKSKVKGGLNHTAHKSRGVLLCGDVVPIKKRNGTLGSATLWVKEKKGGLIWVLEEIAEDLAFVTVDEVGCVVKAEGAVEQIWGGERIRRGMDIKRLIPAIPRLAGTNTGALDYQSITDTTTYTARTSNDLSIPVTVFPTDRTFSVSSFPHIAGIMVLNSHNLQISSSNTVFSNALFGQSRPEGLHINEIIPGFDTLLHLISDEEKVKLVDGMVIPEHSFRRARALVAMREGHSSAISIFLRPSGIPARHRDGSEIMVDIQMRVVKSERSHVVEDVIEELEEEGTVGSSQQPTTEVVYALWITYSRHLHASLHELDTGVLSKPSRAPSPCQQPAPGQSDHVPDLQLDDDSHIPSKTLTALSRQLKGVVKSLTKDKSAPSSESEGSTDIKDGTPQRKTINDFVVIEDMGQGAYGQVKLCRYKRPPGKKMVIKYVTKKRILVDTWTRDRKLGTVPLEIHVLNYLRREDLKHPNIVEMADFFEDDVNYYIEMVPHGLPGMDLFDYIELRADMSEKEARKIFVQVAEAVCHLHIKAKVVHRDIKDENVILDGDGNIKLIDFGSAAYIKNGPFDVFVGTIDYAAPEVLAGQPYRGKEQDVWALGILLYTIIYKENPFYSIDEIMDHDLRVPYVISETSIDLVRLMLNRDVDQRISITEVLEHPWCRGVGAEEDQK
ncbi:Pkinase-domain-containing protein [Microthyrium microscopicum]|uniref:non-specific serine/threonine protein kinase n=1 Tax=Microthyrium microscopicum TaxID=703497 RepID=A0A6A6TWB0_9PEZI|nr:Pkinase-domain-containing protein [Microthyrium microscopicum]